ncbi:MAG: hypothetical protein QOF86_2734 [Baekduia sp.]|jgi:hypothetical protein|nr:hypothetical protein [Baekduia sp.]
MLGRIIFHLRNNVVGYVALFAALGGTSYAAVRLAPGSVTNRALARGAVSHSKLATNSVTSADIANGSIKPGDFARETMTALTKTGGGVTTAAGGSTGATGNRGANGGTGTAGTVGPAGPSGAAGAAGTGSVIVRARGTGTVSAPHGASTAVPINDAAWTQSPGEMDLITGTATITIPSACTGSFGNALVLSVDGTPATFALAPSSPASGTVTMPFNVTSVMEPASSAAHHLTASLANSCTKAGEDYSVGDVKLDVVKFN